MTIRIRLQGMVVEVDTAQELREVLPVIAVEGTRAESSKVLSPKRERGSLKVLYKKIQGANQGRLLRAIRQHPDGMSDSELRKELQLQDNSALAGVMAGISKNASKVGFKFADVIVREEMKGDNGRRAYHYKLTEEMAKVIPGMLMPT